MYGAQACRTASSQHVLCGWVILTILFDNQWSWLWTECNIHPAASCFPTVARMGTMNLRSPRIWSGGAFGFVLWRCWGKCNEKRVWRPSSTSWQPWALHTLPSSLILVSVSIKIEICELLLQWSLSRAEQKYGPWGTWWERWWPFWALGGGAGGLAGVGGTGGIIVHQIQHVRPGCAWTLIKERLFPSSWFGEIKFKVEYFILLSTFSWRVSGLCYMCVWFGFILFNIKKRNLYFLLGKYMNGSWLTSFGKDIAQYHPYLIWFSPQPIFLNKAISIRLNTISMIKKNYGKASPCKSSLYISCHRIKQYS